MKQTDGTEKKGTGMKTLQSQDSRGNWSDCTMDNLQSLCEAMRNDAAETLDNDGWRTDLPTFGGVEPVDTNGVWSWDATHLIVGTCNEDLEIIERHTVQCNRCGETIGQCDAIEIDGYYYCELPYGGCSYWGDTDWVPDQGYAAASRTEEV